MSKKYKFAAITALMLSLAPLGRAHICNDVFIQAKDNLAVKVDIRDGQLRIGQEASFKVYLLNTMDRVILNISLEVLSDQFTADVRPDSSWRSYPELQTSLQGGKKEAFVVRLRRKPGVPDGRYNISLRLVDSRNRQFKTVDLAEAESLHVLSPAPAIRIDGEPMREEWGNALLCTDFYEYVRNDRFFENVPARNQSRFRIAADRDNLYVLLHFMGHENAQSDRATLFLARDPDSQPLALEFDRDTGAVSAPANLSRQIETRVVSGRGAVECRIPRAAVGLAGPGVFYANFVRKASEFGRDTVTYWRGNANSIRNPVVYDKIALNF